MSINAKSILEDKATSASRHTTRRRRSKRWLWILLVIVVLLAILGDLGWNFTVNPMLACEQYYIAIRDQDYVKAYSYLGSTMRARLTQEAFTQQARQRDSEEGKMTQYTESNVPMGDPATITETIKRAHGATYTAHVEMKQEGGQWKVTSFDRF